MKIYSKKNFFSFSVKPEDVFKFTRMNNDFENLFFYYNFGLVTTRHAFKSKNVKAFMRTKQQFDLIVTEQFFQESFLMFSKLFNAPIITCSTFGYWDHMDRMMGFVVPWSFIPHFLNVDLGDELNYFQRFYNTILGLTDASLRHFHYLPKHDEMIQEYFSDLIDGPLPSSSELEKSVSLILVNTHLIITKPRPLMPGLVSVAGSHIKPVKPLPANLKKILDESTNGVIYFSLGSYMQSSQMPPEKMKIFLNTFKKLKQTILWKFEDNNIPELPSNVHVQKWMPQTDILAHPNVIAYIAHGGMFGTTESIYFGIPMLIIPFFGDQLRNGKVVESNGIGCIIRFNEITEELLYSRLNELISNKYYYNNAQKMSKIIRDSPINPLDESIFWMEYVIRHKGAPHLKSAALKLSWISYLLLDVVAGFLFIIFAIVFLIKYLIRTIFREKDVKSNASKKKKN